MAADAVTADAEIDGGEAAGGVPKSSGFKKLILLILLPLLLLGGAAGVMFSGIFDPFGLSGSHAEDPAAEEHAAAEPAPETLAFFDLPDLLVNIESSTKRPAYLKMRVSLEVANETDIEALQRLSPRIIDSFQMYLRELRMEDMRGSAGLARLREELLRRVNASVHPVKIRDVLFREMLVQ